MLSLNLCNAICDQLNRETYNSQLYKAMSFEAEAAGWFGFQKYFLDQSAGELEHSQKMVDYLQDRLCKPIIQAIPAPPREWPSLTAMMQAAGEAERETTKNIYGILKVAQNEGDFGTHSVFEWFATEQIEEEKSVSDILLRLKLAGNNQAAVFEIDESLGE